MARMIYSAPSSEEAMSRAAEELRLPPEALEMEILDDNREDESVEEEERGVCIRVQVSTDHTARRAVELLRGLLDKMKVEAQVEMRKNGGMIHLSVVSPQSSILIGRDGNTLDAMQHWLIRAIGCPAAAMWTAAVWRRTCGVTPESFARRTLALKPVLIERTGARPPHSMT